MKRRDILKGLTILPLAGGVLGSALPMESVKAATSKARGASKRDFFKELGVTPVINAGATMTRMSGSLMMPETLEAINATAHSFVDMMELQAAVGKKISEMLGCESGLVSSGCAGAILLGTAACITGSNRQLVSVMPNVPGPQREVIKLTSHRYGWDSVIRTVGAKIVYVKDAEEMEKAFNANTVMMQYNNGASRNGMTWEEFVAIAKKHNIPTMIDIAADVPPAENLFKFQKIGFDLICLSGGKMLRGPQSAGLLFGKKALIDAAMMNNSPNEVPIGRPCKVNKEEIFGMYAALKSFVERDHDKEWQMWLDRIKQVSTVLEKVPSVKTTTRLPQGPTNNTPGMSVNWDPAKVKITGQEITAALKSGTPSIQGVSGGPSSLNLSLILMSDDEVGIIAKRVKEILDPAIVKTAKA